MKVFVIIVAVLCLKESNCGGPTTLNPFDSSSPDDLIIKGHGEDLVSEFSAKVLEKLDSLSESFDDIIKKHENDQPDFINGRSLQNEEKLKDETWALIQSDFSDFIAEISSLVDIDRDAVDEIFSNSPDLTESQQKIVDFLRTGQMIIDSAKKVIDGKESEFLIGLMNGNQPQQSDDTKDGC